MNSMNNGAEIQTQLQLISKYQILPYSAWEIRKTNIGSVFI